MDQIRKEQGCRPQGGKEIETLLPEISGDLIGDNCRYTQ